ncbi:putative zinc metalloproteinase YIL108W [Sitophilus oryzae]|uniref:Zinc metalloproteinase YIL108W n=1 Tax=Sitophilus oryzae TaxID=7048 RepID=A0A6J2X6X7_SITOR|nr:putative zinc metalloproteinase YIL108W [Sitophilus oryzae]
MNIFNCSHNINIRGFEDDEVVTYPLIRLTGTVEWNENIQSCQEETSNLILLIKNSNAKLKVSCYDNKFKVLLELDEGRNEFWLTYGCRSRSIILSYSPLKSDYQVTPLYVICEGHNGKFQAPSNENNDIQSACDRILLATKLLQCFSAEKMFENGLGRKTFNIEMKCQIFHSKVKCQDVPSMNQQQLWESIGRDIMTSEIGSEKQKYLAFLSCTIYHGDGYTDSMKTHEELINITDGYVALGGGGLALFGTACLYTWPEKIEDIICKFEDETLVDKSKFLDDSCYRGTLGACFSTTLGSVLHELYHTFNLGHTQNGIMGRGFDNVQNFFLAKSHLPGNEEITSKSFQDHIEFKEEFEASKLSERLLNENKKKEYSIIKKFEDDHCTFLTKSCAVMLCYHKWFNSSSSVTTSYTLTYDRSNKFIRSTAGIRVVEIRTEEDEMITYDWTFEGKVLKFSFQIPIEVFQDKRNYLLVVEDNLGNILKATA